MELHRQLEIEYDGHKKTRNKTSVDSSYRHLSTLVKIVQLSGTSFRAILKPCFICIKPIILILFSKNNF